MVRVGLLVFVAACSFTDGAASHSDGGTRPDAPPDSGLCAPSYTLAYGGHQYMLSTPMSWGIDSSLCSTSRGHMVKIEDSGEDNFAHMQFSSGYMWTGLHLDTGDNMYHWTDGSLLGSYNGFHNGNVPPPDVSQQCVEIVSTTGEWQIFNCNFAQIALCECP